MGCEKYIFRDREPQRNMKTKEKQKSSSQVGRTKRGDDSGFRHGRNSIITYYH